MHLKNVKLITFLILNPDVVIQNNLIKNVLAQMINNKISIISPVAVSKSGNTWTMQESFQNSQHHS